MSSLRVACVGAGYFSRFHYDAWARLAEVDVVGAMDASLEAATLTGCTPFNDLAHMLETTSPQLLDIITPPTTHLEFVRQAVQAKVEIIICQKPFCTSLGEAQQATTLCQDAGIPLIIHENFRFQPWYRCMHQAILDGTLGDVHQMTFRLRTGDGQGPDAYLDRQPYFQSMPKLLIHETGVHWIDTFRYLMGEPIAVYADLRKMNPVIAGEDAAYVVFDFGNGKRAVFDGNRHLDHAALNHRMTLGECLLEGTRASLQLSGDGQVSLRTFGSMDSTVLLPAQDWPGFAGDCVYALQKHVVDALLSGHDFENRAEDYLSVLRVESAIYTSAQTHQRVNIPPHQTV